MYVIIALGFFIKSRSSRTVTRRSSTLIERANTCCSRKCCAEALSRLWIKRLFIIREHLQPRASSLNHYVSFSFPQNTLLKHFLDAPCLFFSWGEFNQNTNMDQRETSAPQWGFSAYVSMINERYGEWGKGEGGKDGEGMHKKTTGSLSAINLMTPYPIEWQQNGCRGLYPLLPIC